MSQAEELINNINTCNLYTQIKVATRAKGQNEDTNYAEKTILS